MDVIVDDKDLEALLHASSALPAIEAALKARDPVFHPSAKRVSQVHASLNTALLNARRQVQYPERFRDPTPEEIEDLYRLMVIGGDIVWELTVEDSRPHRHLMLLGLIRIGAQTTTISWSNGDVTNRPGKHIVALTDKGHEHLMPLHRERSVVLDCTAGQVVEVAPGDNGCTRIGRTDLLGMLRLRSTTNTKREKW